MLSKSRFEVLLVHYSIYYDTGTSMATNLTRVQSTVVILVLRNCTTIIWYHLRLEYNMGLNRLTLGCFQQRPCLFLQTKRIMRHTAPSQLLLIALPTQRMPHHILTSNAKQDSELLGTFNITVVLITGLGFLACVCKPTPVSPPGDPALNMQPGEDLTVLHW